MRTIHDGSTVLPVTFGAFSPGDRSPFVLDDDYGKLLLQSKTALNRARTVSQSIQSPQRLDAISRNSNASDAAKAIRSLLDKSSIAGHRVAQVALLDEIPQDLSVALHYTRSMVSRAAQKRVGRSIKDLQSQIAQFNDAYSGIYNRLRTVRNWLTEVDTSFPIRSEQHGNVTAFLMQSQKKVKRKSDKKLFLITMPSNLYLDRFGKPNIDHYLVDLRAELQKVKAEFSDLKEALRFDARSTRPAGIMSRQQQRSLAEDPRNPASRLKTAMRILKAAAAKKHNQPDVNKALSEITTINNKFFDVKRVMSTIKEMADFVGKSYEKINSGSSFNHDGSKILSSIFKTMVEIIQGTDDRTTPSGSGDLEILSS